eukprot:scaffold72020_cov18-Prasinocladus_malaysianus.AAC.2
MRWGGPASAAPCPPCLPGRAEGATDYASHPERSWIIAETSPGFGPVEGVGALPARAAWGSGRRRWYPGAGRRCAPRGAPPRLGPPGGPPASCWCAGGSVGCRGRKMIRCVSPRRPDQPLAQHGCNNKRLSLIGSWLID